MRFHLILDYIHKYRQTLLYLFCHLDYLTKLWCAMGDKFPDIHKPKQNISCAFFKYGESKHNINCKALNQNACNLTHSMWCGDTHCVTRCHTETVSTVGA